MTVHWVATEKGSSQMTRPLRVSTAIHASTTLVSGRRHSDSGFPGIRVMSIRAGPGVRHDAFEWFFSSERVRRKTEPARDGQGDGLRTAPDLELGEDVFDVRGDG